MPALSKIANSKSVHSNTPPDSSAQLLSTITLIFSQFQQLLDTVKQAAGGVSDSESVSETGSSMEKDNEKKNRIRASKLEFKIINEVYAPASGIDFLLCWQMPAISWNKKTYKHEIKESLQSSEKEDEYKEYIFVHRRKFGMFVITW
jgi:hypothetical protein